MEHLFGTTEASRGYRKIPGYWDPIYSQSTVVCDIISSFQILNKFLLGDFVLFLFFADQMSIFLIADIVFIILCIEASLLENIFQVMH